MDQETFDKCLKKIKLRHNLSVKPFNFYKGDQKLASKFDFYGPVMGEHEVHLGYLGDCTIDMTKTDSVTYGHPENLPAKLIKLITEFAHEATRKPKQWYIHIIQDNDSGYLNFDTDNSNYGFADKGQSFGFQTKFTTEEVEKLKQSGKLAIDWDKALEEVMD